MKKMYFLVLVSMMGLASWGQITLPINFETGTFAFTNFDGGNATVIDNPQKIGINTSNRVGQMIKGPGGQPWGGAFLDLSSPIDFDQGKTIRVKVFSPRAGALFLFKVENSANPAQFHEVEVGTTVANAWEDLTINFGSVNTAFSYNRVVVIFERGTTGAGGASFTFLFDDIRQEGGTPTSTVPILPLDFESSTLVYAFNDFDGGASTVINNPHKGGLNNSERVARMIKNAGQTWGGSLLELRNPIDFSTNKTFRMKVYAPRVGVKVLLKVENKDNPGINFEAEATTTKANEWEDLTFNYSTINTAQQYQKLVFIFENGTTGDGSANFTFFFDDIRLESGGGGGGGAAPPVPAPNPPARAAGDVVSIFSDVFTSSATMSRAAFTGAGNPVRIIEIEGNNTFELTTNGGPFTGFQLSNAVDLSNMTFLHYDIWIAGTPQPGAVFNTTVSQHGGGHLTGETMGYVHTNIINAGQEGRWLSFDIPFSTFAPNLAAGARNIISELVFTHVNSTNTGPIFMDNVYFYREGPLPVRWASFTASAKANNVVLNWETATEINNSGFAIERSHDGRAWSELSFVKATAANGSGSTYSHVDFAPMQGTNYYRLRQVDFDGKFSFSQIRQVNFNGKVEAVAVYPNPARQQLQVVANEFTGKGNYTIMDMQGRQVQSGVFPQLQTPMQIGLNKLAPGIYSIVLRDGTKTETVRFIVQ